MLKNRKKSLVITYFLVGIILSIYVSWYRLSVLSFIMSVVFGFLCFVGIYFCIKGFSKNKGWLKIMRSLGVLISIALFIFIWITAHFSGFNSSSCYDVVAKNLITGSTHVYCNYPSWYTEIIEGEEARLILLEDCKSRKSAFYEQHPEYCDKYEEIEIDVDSDLSVRPTP